MVHAGAIAEQLECQAVSTGGNAAAGGAKPKPVFDITAKAEVAAPLLQMSKQAVVFSYIHAQGHQPLIMEEALEIRCAGKHTMQLSLILCKSAGLGGICHPAGSASMSLPVHTAHHIC